MKWISTFLVLLLVGSCASPPPKKLTLKEKVERDHTVGQQVALKIERHFDMVDDLRVSNYLTAMALRLMKSTEELQDSKVEVSVISDEKGKWHNLGLPGIRIYLSKGLTKKIEFENELAAAIAMELAHVRLRHFASRFESTSQLKVFQGKTRPNEVVIYTPQERFDAIQSAVDILYRSGYDPRGFVTYWGKFEKSSKNSPYSSSELLEYKRKTRASIVRYAPLLNPVVRTDEFLLMQKRIRNL